MLPRGSPGCVRRENHSRMPTAHKLGASPATSHGHRGRTGARALMSAACAPGSTATCSTDPTPPAIARQRPRAHRGRRGVRGDQGRRRAAVRARPGTSSGCGRSAAGLGLPEPDLDDGPPRRGARCSPAERLPLGRIRITYTGGPAPLGSGRGDDRPTTVVVAATRCEPGAEATAVVTVPWPRNERGRTGRRSRPRRTPRTCVALAEAAERRAPARRCSPTLAGPPVRGHRHQRLLRRRRRAAHADARRGLPGRRHPRPGPRVVRRPRGRRADRGARTGQRDLPRLHDAGRPGRRALERRETSRTARSPGLCRRSGEARSQSSWVTDRVTAPRGGPRPARRGPCACSRPRPGPARRCGSGTTAAPASPSGRRAGRRASRSPAP